MFAYGWSIPALAAGAGAVAGAGMFIWELAIRMALWPVASGLAGMLSVSSIVAGTNGFSVVG